ncbi:MAG: immunoglobulin domain-containing protein, partial [Gammaproteobacteria bacterium]
SKIAALGSSVTFTVRASGASGYQWYKDGSAIPGATDSSLTIASVRGLPMPHMPQAASMSSFFRQLGGTVGVGMVGMLLEWRLRAHGSDPLSAFSETFLVLAAVCASTAFASWWMRPAEPA